MNWEQIEPWDYVVVAVASEYHKKYNMIELEDIKQSLYEWFVSHPKKLSEWVQQGEKDTKNLLYRSLRNQALDYCQLWRSKSIGYEVSDLFYYDPDVIEALLPAVIRGDLNDAPKLNLGMPGRPPAPSEGGNMMAMMVDIKSAFDSLNAEDKSILYLKYVDSMSYGAIAEELKIPSDDASRMRHNRAIKKLITRLGGYRPFLDKENESDKEGGDYEEDNVSTDNQGEDTED
jgi:RNA polymerase sigma factor (sigma-70 family)